MADTGAREPQDAGFAIAELEAAVRDYDETITGKPWRESAALELLNAARNAIWALAAGVGVPPDAGYGMKQRRRAQAAEDTLTDFREAARGAFNGVRGTSRTTDSDDVRVTFTDRGWEACKRLFSLAGVGEARPAEPPPKCYCGSLEWTVRVHGRITHKHACPARVDAFCQTHPEGCPAEQDSSVGAPAEEQPDARKDEIRRRWRTERRAYWRNLAETAEARVSALTEQLDELADAVEYDAARRAYAAGFGGSEWQAFISTKLWDALQAARAALGVVAAGADEFRKVSGNASVSAPSNTEGRAGDKEAL